MPNYEYCNKKGECFDRLFLSWRDAPKEIDGCVRQFPNPAVRFKGPFSGGTKLFSRPDDGRVIEDGTKDDNKRRQKEIADKRDQDRKDHIAKQLSEYDL
jgi:hypothetical protein